jgi:hypothetical protein
VVFVVLTPVDGHAEIVSAPMNADGTFGSVEVLNPLEHTLIINDGDSIEWTGLGTTDSIVQIAGPPAAGADLCADVGVRRAYNVNAPYAPNEFTGPIRPAASGIFPLAPNTCGLYEIDKSQTACAPGDAELPHGSGDCELLVSSCYKLCERRSCAPEDKYTVMPETWANPDVTGVFLRLDWSDLNPGPEVTADGFDWSFLDREMDQAVRHGKVFTIGIRTANSIPK